MSYSELYMLFWLLNAKHFDSGPCKTNDLVSGNSIGGLSASTRKPTSDDKPYTCDLCGKSFSQQRYLKLHSLRNHSDVNSHHCEVCYKGFTTPSSVKRHMLTHSGDKPYACKDCGRRFSQPRSLKLHLLHR